MTRGHPGLALLLLGAACSRPHLQARLPERAQDSVAITYAQGMEDFRALAAGSGPEAAYVYNSAKHLWYEVGERSPVSTEGEVLQATAYRLLVSFTGDTAPVHVHTHRDTTPFKSSMINSAEKLQAPFHVGASTERKQRVTRLIQGRFDAEYALPSGRDISNAIATQSIATTTIDPHHVRFAVVSSYGTIFYDVAPASTPEAIDSLEREYEERRMVFSEQLLLAGEIERRSVPEVVRMLCSMVSTPRYTLTFVPH